MARRFRKVFIVCEDNQVFTTVTQIHIYKARSGAECACKLAQTKAVEESIKLWNANKPVPKFKVHGFYLVHEDMFKE